MIRSLRLRTWSARFAVFAGVTTASLGLIAPAQAEPLWPHGPNVPGAPAIVPTKAPCSAQARACLRLSTNESWLIDQGRVIYGPARMSHGMPGFETPPGVFHVAFKRPFHWSTMHHAPMRWAVFFNGDIAYHVGPVQAASHGCIRLEEETAHRHFDHLAKGDIVEVVP